MKLETIQIAVEGFQLPLAGLLYTPEGEAKPVGIVLAHGFTSGKYSLDGVASYLAERGYECVTFDAVGHKLGGTGGRMLRIAQAADNLRQAVLWYRQHGARSIVLIGHSMGGAAALAVASQEAGARDRPIAGVCSLCMGDNPMTGFSKPLGAAMLKQRFDYVDGAPADELLAGMPELMRDVGGIEIPALLIAARNDVLLPVQSVRSLAERIGPNAELLEVNALHLDAPDRSRAQILNWLERVGR